MHSLESLIGISSSPPKICYVDISLNEVVAKHAFSLKTVPTYLWDSNCNFVEKEAPEKMCKRKDKQTKAVTIAVLHKQGNDKRGVAE